MKKKVIAIVLAILVCLPCILLLDGGPNAPYGDESFGWTNAFGFAYLAFLALGGFHLLTPKWLREEMDKMFDSEEEETEWTSEAE